MSQHSSKGAVASDPFETLLPRMRGRLYQQAYRSLNNAADAEDVAQEAMVRAWMHLDTLRADPNRDPERVLGVWLYRITFNLLKEVVRHRRRHSALSLDAPPGDSKGGALVDHLPDHSKGPAEIYEDGSLSERLHRALVQLTPDHRKCIELLSEERSYEEEGALMDCPLETVSSRINRARTSMRRSLHEESG